ncbi:hypothetical protein SEMRO_2649_G333680.1 [Seminavis robusta]|uniref:Uncharacterized protein n=1 Tax=Seminavis robusta TaxID=568900 RepID=A0A9N8F368_9STRA|nr:hypothetical protein SEMRO_2649_G333680.1 [Seminavis robusta]|eukprot:Sro2649_g333680.1 n/a (153) ;mRNA; r:4489-5135
MRQEWDIRNTSEDACDRLKKYTRMMPEKHFCLSFSYNDLTGGYILVEDTGGYDIQVLNTEHGLRSFITGLYYVIQAMNADFLSIRMGVSVVLECAGFDIVANMNNKISKTICDNLYCNYPFAIHEEADWTASTCSQIHKQQLKDSSREFNKV